MQRLLRRAACTPASGARHSKRRRRLHVRRAECCRARRICRACPPAGATPLYVSLNVNGSISANNGFEGFDLSKDAGAPNRLRQTACMRGCGIAKQQLARPTLATVEISVLPRPLLPA